MRARTSNGGRGLDHLGRLADWTPDDHAPAEIAPRPRASSTLTGPVDLPHRRRPTPVRRGSNPVELPRLPALEPACRELLAGLAAPTVLLAAIQPTVGIALRAWAEDQGLTVAVTRDLQGSFTVLARSPSLVAVIADEQLDVDGALEAELRQHALHRTVPFRTIDARAVAAHVTERSTALRPLVRWLGEALAPLVEIWAALRRVDAVTADEGEHPLAGAGVPQLLRLLAAARLTVVLHLRGPHSRARVQLVAGRLCGVVTEPQRSVGALAMLHLVGQDWLGWRVDPQGEPVGAVPLGELEPVLQGAVRQDAAWLSRLYDEGLDRRRFALDTRLLPRLLARMSPGQQALARQLAGGVAAAELARARGDDPALRRLLVQLRRAGAISPRAPAARPLTGEAARIVPSTEVPVFRPLPEPPPAAEPEPLDRTVRLGLIVVGALSVLALATAAWYLLLR